MKNRLLYIGDHSCDTGFARNAHEVLKRLHSKWEIFVLGINHLGDPNTFPYQVYPAWPSGDGFGLGRVKALLEVAKPDVVLVQNDPWNIKAYLDKIKGAAPVVATVPVDGQNCKGDQMNGLAAAIFWTKFGLDEARDGGYIGRAEIVPLSVDTVTYRPADKQAARLEAGIPPKYADAFLVGNVNRNQQRKRLDLTISYFAEWINEYEVTDAYLLLHVCPTGDDAYDLPQLMRYFKAKDRLLLSSPGAYNGVAEEVLCNFYNCMDVQVTTTQGEGWGLTTMEGMACGIPQIVPNWSALGEWTLPGAYPVPCTEIAVTPATQYGFINVVGGVPDRKFFIQVLDSMYRDRKARLQHGEACRRHVQAMPSWNDITRRYDEVLTSVLHERDAARQELTNA